MREVLFAMILLALAACDDDPGPPSDGDADADGDVDADGDGDGDVDGDGDADGDADGDGDGDADPVCQDDDECDNGLYCDGVEGCDPEASGADDFGCLAGAPPDCDDGVADTIDTCSEEVGRCVHECPDLDGDGHADADCLNEEGDPLGDDCDDDDPDRFPGNVEFCDLEGHDEDCDLTTVGSVDDDLDGAISMECCNEVAGMSEPVCGTDCNDDNPDINPRATEVCDVADVDEDCDGEVNEFLTVFCWADEDNDTWAAAGAMLLEQCPTEGRGHVGGCPEFSTDREPVDESTTDCNDAEPSWYPGAEELCDGEDNDCDGALSGLPGVLDETDRDGDGFVECASDDRLRDCADDDADAFPGQTAYYEREVVGVGGHDFNCNGVEEHEITDNGGCIPDVMSGGYCDHSEGWTGVDLPSCGGTWGYVIDCTSAPGVCGLPDNWITEERDVNCR